MRAIKSVILPKIKNEWNRLLTILGQSLHLDQSCPEYKSNFEVFAAVLKLSLS